MESIEIQQKHKHIWTTENSDEEAFLRKKTSEFRYTDYSKKDINALIAHMRKMMSSAYGVGISANQLGFPYRVCVAQLPSPDGKGYAGKFYVLINPRIVSTSGKKITDEEGCLSIPHTYGAVQRSEKVVVEALDKQGRNVAIKAQGLLARIFQHETDHLNGILFTDKAKRVYRVEPHRL